MGAANPADPGPYRAPARESPDAPVPPPSRQTLRRPLRWGVLTLLVVIGPLLAMNLVAHWTYGKDPVVRFAPWVMDLQELVALGLPASFGVVALGIALRVRPLWRGMSRLARGAYVAGVLLAHAFVVIVLAVGFFSTRFYSGLFEPTILDSAPSTDGSFARLFRTYDYGCAYDVYVSPSAWSPMMERTSRIHRKDCDEPVPHLHWSDGAQLVDGAGQRLEDQPSENHGHWFGC